MAVDDPVRAVLEGKELAAVEVMVLNLVSNVSAAFSCAFESPEISNNHNYTTTTDK